MLIINQRSGLILAHKVHNCNTFFARLRGLMFMQSLPDSICLILHPCNMIHTFFMRFAIDVLFLDKNHIVVYTKENMHPWRIGKLITKAHTTLEFPAGTIERSGTRVGDQIQGVI